MADFGFDAYVLDGDDAGAHPHPLEIARDLIVTGKPRSALEILSMHHDQLVDRPEYLLLCAEAWWLDGDSIRAQQALLGAARLAPEDPTPMQMLGELLRERGEHERADRALAKARSLQAPDRGDHDPAGGLESEDDLIAFAERQERSARGGLTTTQIVMGVIALLAIAALVTGIVLLTTPDSGSQPEVAEESSVITAPATSVAPEPRAVMEPKATGAPEPEPEPELEAEPEPQVEPEPEPASPQSAANVPRSKSARKISSVVVPKPAPRPKAKPAPKPLTAPPPEDPGPGPGPDPRVVQQELSSLDAAALTQRADLLHSRGHTGVAASYYRRALELDPDYAPAMIGIGRSILRAEKYSDAMKTATRALQLARGVDARPGLEAEAIYQMARVHLHRGELDAARRLFRQSISLPGAPAPAWFYLGEALWNDNSPAAREAYQRYLELVPTGSLADRARRAIQ